MELRKECTWWKRKLKFHMPGAFLLDFFREYDMIIQIYEIMEKPEKMKIRILTEDVMNRNNRRAREVWKR